MLKVFYTQYKNTDPFTAKILVEKAKEKTICRTESTSKTAYYYGDGRCICTSVYERLSPNV